MFRRCRRLLGSTNRYTDGSGRALDSSELPRDLYVQPISNRAYPTRAAHWEPVLASEPMPHKGRVLISGGGVVGMTTAALFALRGWHTTVFERHAASHLACPTDHPHGEDQYRYQYHHPSSLRPEHALVTRRAMDALESAGLRVGAVARCGVAVSGVMDHPGAYNSWLTRGLTEYHPFALKMLSVNLCALRQVLEQHISNLPMGNCRIFHEHVVEAVYPLKQQVVVRPLRDQSSDACAQSNAEDNITEKSSRRLETSLTLNPIKWERKYAKDAVHYDLLVCAEGVNSQLRDLLDVEGFAADGDFAVRWFELRSTQLSHSHIHRWLHKRITAADKKHHMRSPFQVPLSIAFPSLPWDSVSKNEKEEEKQDSEEDSHCFALMVYGPVADISRLSGAEVLATFCPDLVSDGAKSTDVVASRAPAVPYPTIYCENLFNSVGLPSAVVVGDAAHTCNPFWLQGLAMGLEDGVNLLNQVDAYSKHFYDAIRQYSQERGCNGDGLRELTDRCLYYERKKHVNPFLRFQNSYQSVMNAILPQFFNEYYSGASLNHVYAKSIESMLNGRGYTSYEFAEKQQAKHRAFYHLGRVYT